MIASNPPPSLQATEQRRMLFLKYIKPRKKLNRYRLRCTNDLTQNKVASFLNEYLLNEFFNRIKTIQLKKRKVMKEIKEPENKKRKEEKRYKGAASNLHYICIYILSSLSKLALWHHTFNSLHFLITKSINQTFIFSIFNNNKKSIKGWAFRCTGSYVFFLIKQVSFAFSANYVIFINHSSTVNILEFSHLCAYNNFTTVTMYKNNLPQAFFNFPLVPAKKIQFQFGGFCF